jgi:uncharacterized membrane protein YwaF
MNDFFASLWGEDWVTTLVIIFLLALLITLIKDVLKRWRGFRRWIRKFPSERLHSVQRLLYLAKAKRRDRR